MAKHDQKIGKLSIPYGSGSVLFFVPPDANIVAVQIDPNAMSHVAVFYQYTYVPEPDLEPGEEEIGWTMGVVDTQEAFPRGWFHVGTILDRGRELHVVKQQTAR